MAFKYTVFALLALIAVAYAATNGRQMRGRFTSPLPATVSFNIPETEGIGACIYIGAAGASEQTGGLFMRIAECNDTSLTALVSDACNGRQTFPISDLNYTVGTEISGTMDVSQRFNGVAYTEYFVECYDPTPSQVLAPAPGAVPPQAPVPVPISSSFPVPAAASTAVPTFVALVALIGLVASLL